jgi:protein-S-isoprenylcysteine O-methyltransferase Ste14
LTILGLLFVVAGLFWLGSSTRVGLPKEKTELKTGGIYRLTRNPIYVGLHLMVIGAMLYLYHPLIFVFGLYSITVYHYIIISEERFLIERFGQRYRFYLNRTARYLVF